MAAYPPQTESIKEACNELMQNIEGTVERLSHLTNVQHIRQLIKLAKMKKRGDNRESKASNLEDNSDRRFSDNVDLPVTLYDSLPLSRDEEDRLDVRWYIGEYRNDP